MKKVGQILGYKLSSGQRGSIKFQSPSIRLWSVRTAGDKLTVRVSTNLPKRVSQSVRESGSQSGSQGHSLLLVSDPEGLRQKLSTKKAMHAYWYKIFE